jgi:putative Mg2+ transporter-C (MgtC) family protein
MDQLYPWLGDLNQVEGLAREWVALICILASVACGSVIGIERERRDKPAGLRTLVLIAVGSTIFTIVSLALAGQKAMADPARLASQIIPGIGFLGAGAIIQARGTVRGLTTGATIWAVAAVGVAVGSGYVAAGLGVTVIILGTLTLMQRMQALISGCCHFRRAKVVYRPERGKTRPRLQSILDRHEVPDDEVEHGQADPDEHWLRARVCTRHREHREILRELAENAQVVSIDVG